MMNRSTEWRNVKLVVLLLGLLLVVTPALAILLRPERSPRQLVAEAQIHSFGQLLELYKKDTGVYPSTDQGLRALIERPKGVTDWFGPYSKHGLPNDPWGRPYLYQLRSGPEAEPEIRSLGADGRPSGKGEDADISNWDPADQVRRNAD